MPGNNLPGWEQQLAELPAPLPFEDGVIIPIQDIPHRIDHRPFGKGGVWIEMPHPYTDSHARICISGEDIFLSRRLTDWIKKRAKSELLERCHVHTARLGLPPTRITVRDSTTRWGSCSSTGTISFSWRLFFAPPFVLDYVAAHETAHRVHMSHDKPFWDVVDMLTDLRHEAEDWLNAKGNDLHRIGLKA